MFQIAFLDEKKTFQSNWYSDASHQWLLNGPIVGNKK